MTLYWCDGLKVVKYLFANPVFATCMEMTPYKLLDKETGLPVYGEFMSGDFAWEYQVSVPVWHSIQTSHNVEGDYPCGSHHVWCYWSLR
jgi:hypothetical protein